jgi:hypothetical protein
MTEYTVRRKDHQKEDNWTVPSAAPESVPEAKAQEDAKRTVGDLATPGSPANSVGGTGRGPISAPLEGTDPGPNPGGAAPGMRGREVGAGEGTAGTAEVQDVGGRTNRHGEGSTG